MLADRGKEYSTHRAPRLQGCVTYGGMDAVVMNNEPVYGRTLERVRVDRDACCWIPDIKTLSFFRMCWNIHGHEEDLCGTCCLERERAFTSQSSLIAVLDLVRSSQVYIIITGIGRHLWYSTLEHLVLFHNPSFQFQYLYHQLNVRTCIAILRDMRNDILPSPLNHFR